MRTFLFAAAIMSLAAQADAATRNFGITSFTKIRVDGPFKVSLATGVAPFARASGSPGALDRVAIEVQGDTLVVQSSASSWGGYPGANAGSVDINVGTHDLADAWLNGSGSLAIDKVKGLSFALSVQGAGGTRVGEINEDQLNVSLIGTASATLAGHARKLTALVRGISTLDAVKLDTHDATVGAEGAATIDANVSDAVKVQASGPATVRFVGRPSCTSNVSGSASVSGCR